MGNLISHLISDTGLRPVKEEAVNTSAKFLQHLQMCFTALSTQYFHLLGYFYLSLLDFCLFLFYFILRKAVS